MIGSIDFKYVPKNGVTEVGYGMNPKYIGNGYMTEALTAFCEFGKTLGIKKILADTLPDNIRSQNVLKRCGFTFLKEDGNLWWEKDLGAPEERENGNDKDN
ncbi:MAG: GNAT family N-acetyltransferase [Clostridia bacterium]|nr:GNAT family N-acetyltransferase [Clostridia bacterium]